MALIFITEAVFSKGVLEPVDNLPLRERQRVRLIIEPLEVSCGYDRAAALDRLRAGIARMEFSSSDPRLSRDELHDRF